MPRATLSQLIDNKFVDARAVGDPTHVTIGQYNWVEQLESQLVSIDSGYYTPEMLDSMTVNDLVFAVRTHRDSAGFVPSGTNTVNPGVMSFSEPQKARRTFTPTPPSDEPSDDETVTTSSTKRATPAARTKKK